MSPIPFPEDWYLDEEGIHIESGWNEAIGLTTPTTSTSFPTGTTLSDG